MFEYSLLLCLLFENFLPRRPVTVIVVEVVVVEVEVEGVFFKMDENLNLTSNYIYTY